MGDIPHAELAGERLEDLACDAGLLRLDDIQCFRRTSCCRAPCAPNAAVHLRRTERPQGARPDVRRNGLFGGDRSRARRGHCPELPKRRQIVDHATLSDDFAVTDLENHDLVELGPLPGGRKRPPLALLGP